MYRAVHGLAIEVRIALVFYILGLFLLYPSLVFFTFYNYSIPIATATSITLATVLLLTVRLGWKTWKRFYLDPKRMIHSHFEPNRWQGSGKESSPASRQASSGTPPALTEPASGSAQTSASGSSSASASASTPAPSPASPAVHKGTLPDAS